jgi:hypothetical protein
MADEINDYKRKNKIMWGVVKCIRLHTSKVKR